MSKDFFYFLRHIYDECSFLLSVSKGKDIEDILNDEILKRAIVRSLEIIGEATKKISKEFKDNHFNVNWENMAGMRAG